MRREIKHDPESGCDACPFLRTWGDRDEPTRWCMGGECDAAGSGDPAPGWCPLRAGEVVVARDFVAINFAAPVAYVSEKGKP